MDLLKCRLMCFSQSSEALRDELDTVIRQHQSITSRSLSYPQVVFLLAVAKLESMRAELGDPSLMLQYFHNEGVNRGPLVGPLNDISQKASYSRLAACTFLRSLTVVSEHRLPSHSWYLSTTKFEGMPSSAVLPRTSYR